jgi:sigma-B regulation protein RsbU (phosphoserine phosphatase)
VALSAGDTLLLTSDGLSEQRNAADTPLGFEGAAEALRQTAGAPPGTIVERVIAAAAAWRDHVEQTDDITLVAVRVRAPEAA